MLPYGNISRERILQDCKTNPEAVATLVVHLLQRTADLEKRIKELEARLNQNSQNSNKPPSSDGYKKPAPKSLRSKSGKTSGGQPGHQGHRLEMIDHPNHIITHTVSSCKACKRSLMDVPAVSYDRRQVFDLVVKMEATEYRAEKVCCPDCGEVTQAAFPDRVPYPVQYGNNMKAVTCYLSTQQLLPLQRLTDLFQDLAGHRISQGTIVNIAHSVYNNLKPFEEVAIQALQSAPVLNCDESGLRVKGKNHWLHGATDGHVVHYTVHEKRGNRGIDDAGVLPEYKGTAVHDGWSPYATYTNCKHALCNAHHDRELQGVMDNYDNQSWAERMIAHLYDIKDAVEEAKNEGQTSLPPDQITLFETWYDDIIQQGHEENPPSTDKPKKKGRIKQSKAKNLLDRLDNKRKEVLAFMYDFQVPFTNNEAERIIRMIKVQQKISGTFRSKEGAKIFCRIRSYIATLQKHGLPVLDNIRNALEGNPFLPKMPTS